MAENEKAEQKRQRNLLSKSKPKGIDYDDDDDDEYEYEISVCRTNSNLRTRDGSGCSAEKMVLFSEEINCLAGKNPWIPPTKTKWEQALELANVVCKHLQMMDKKMGMKSARPNWLELDEDMYL
jgi:hypothetical protein